MTNKFNSHLLGGKSLPIAYKSYSQTLHSITSPQNFTLTLARGFTKQDAICISLFDTKQAGAKCEKYILPPVRKSGSDEA